MLTTKQTKIKQYKQINILLIKFYKTNNFQPDFVLLFGNIYTYHLWMHFLYCDTFFEDLTLLVASKIRYSLMKYGKTMHNQDTYGKLA